MRQVDAAEPARRARPADQRRGARARRAPGRRQRGALRARLRRSEVGFVFQFFNLIANLTVADNVELPGAAGRRARPRGAPPRGELLERLGLEETAAPRARRSVRRPAAARRDRPRAGQPPERPARRRADRQPGHRRRPRRGARCCAQRHDDGQTIVLVTHDMRVASAAQRVVAMRDGADRRRDLPTARGADEVLSRVVSLEA